MKPLHAKSLTPATSAASVASVKACTNTGAGHQRQRQQRSLLCTAVATLLALLGLGGTASSSLAQAVYKSVGPDGKVTFSDRPPPEVPAAVLGKPKASQTVADAELGTSANPPLPYELRQLSIKYPVTLYTTSSCGPCDTGRALLVKRGVPFTEKSVNTNDDIGAFSRISKDNSLPLLTIGGKQIKGFSESEWLQYLDSAGYPKQSALPPRYRQAAAEPMSPLKTAAEAGAAADTPAESADKAPPPPRTAPSRPPAAPPIDPASNPAGIRF